MNIVDTYSHVNIIKKTKYKEISVVFNEIDHLYYIKKELTIYDKDLYLQLQSVKSEHLPKIYLVKEIDDKLIIIEEYINAITLDNVIVNTKLTHDQILKIMSQLCDCLRVLHNLDKPIIHRDIKPENIFYVEGKVILFDFDIARNYRDDKNKDTMILGSVGYASPEHFGFSQSDCRSDIYSLGVLLNVLLCGKIPSESLYQGKEKNIILKATNLDSKKRYSDIDSFKQQLVYNSFALPGFRTNTKWKKIIAIIGYAFLVYRITIINPNGVTDPYKGFGINLSYTLYTLFSYLYFSNYKGMLSMSLFRKSPKKSTRIWGIAITYFIIIVIFSQLVSAIKG